MPDGERSLVMFYEEWLDSSNFALTEALGLAVELGYVEDAERLNQALALIEEATHTGNVTVSITDKGKEALREAKRLASIKDGREKKRKYDEYYSKLRGNKYADSPVSLGRNRFLDAAFASLKQKNDRDKLWYIMSRLIVKFETKYPDGRASRLRSNRYNVSDWTLTPYTIRPFDFFQNRKESE